MSQLDARRPTPLSLVLAVTFLGSLGTGVIVNGIYFLTGFDRAGNYGLGAAFGAAYVLAALGASRTLGALRGRIPGLTARHVLASILTAIAILCFIPSLTDDGLRSWAAWVVAIAYGLLSGLLWPLVEGYVGGGRRDRNLRYATGQFNICWASALVVAFVAMGPFTSDHAEAVLFWLGVAHLGSIALVMRFAAEPGRSGDVDHEVHADTYDRFLRVFRVLLPTSYMVTGALSPYLPSAFEQVGVRSEWQTPVAAAWLLSRVVTFVAMERSHAWHGRWWVAVVGPGAMLVGFTVCLLAPGLDGRGLWLLIAGLCVFGVGMGMIYSGALYYALEVGHEEVASGGTHEALIGSGYLTGPLAGLGVAALVSAGLIGEGAFESAQLVLIMAACAVPAMFGWRAAKGASRRVGLASPSAGPDP